MTRLQGLAAGICLIAAVSMTGCGPKKPAEDAATAAAPASAAESAAPESAAPDSAAPASSAAPEGGDQGNPHPQ